MNNVVLRGGAALTSFLLFCLLFVVDLKQLLHVLFNHSGLSGVGLCVDTCEYSRIAAELVIVLHELPACLLIQTALREGHNKKTLNDTKDMLEGPTTGVPVPLQSVYAYFTRRGCNIRVENLG
jgi:hypothetical protein